MPVYFLSGARREKTLNLTLEDQDVIELTRIFLDEDADGALAFLKTHFKGKSHALQEDSGKVRAEISGAGIHRARGNLSRR